MINRNGNSNGHFDLISQIIENNRNFHSIFEVKLIKQLEHQKRLGLNKIIDSNTKKIILDYLQRQDIKQQLLQQIKSDPILTQFQQCLLKQKDKDFLGLQKKYEKMVQKMKEKSRNDWESLTLKVSSFLKQKQYDILVQDVKKCFIPNASFANNKHVSGEMKQKIESWELKLPKQHFESRFQCKICINRYFVNKPGLSMHEKACKIRKNIPKNRGLGKINTVGKGRKLRKANTRQSRWAN